MKWLSLVLALGLLLAMTAQEAMCEDTWWYGRCFDDDGTVYLPGEHRGDFLGIIAFGAGCSCDERLTNSPNCHWA